MNQKNAYVYWPQNRCQTMYYKFIAQFYTKNSELHMIATCDIFSLNKINKNFNNFAQIGKNILYMIE